MKDEVLGQRIALLSMVVSCALAASKIVIGFKANSTAAVSDGLENAGDVLTSGLVFLGLMIAAKPPDKEHPYGHGRVETLSGLLVGMILVAGGTLISYHSLQRAGEPQHAPAFYAIWPLIASIVIKTSMATSKWFYGRRISSDALLADAWHEATDVLSGVTALVAVSITLINPVRFSAADHFGGFAVGIIVIFAGLRVARNTTLQLMDTMPSPAAMECIRRVALSVPGALAVEKCFARKTGLKWHVDLHLEVDPEMSVSDSHQIATEVRVKIKETLDWVADVLVHVEPHLLDTVVKARHGKS